MIKWHKRTFPCPKCKLDMLIVELLVSCDDQLRVDLWCEPCKQDYRWIQAWGIIRAQCFFADLDGMIHPEQKQIEAPKDTKGDDEFLRNLGIGE